jgi:hypothetical protein
MRYYKKIIRNTIGCDVHDPSEPMGRLSRNILATFHQARGTVEKAT